MIALTYRQLTTAADFHALTALQQTIWGFSDADAVPYHVFAAHTLTGGLVLGAESDAGLMGFALAFPARRNGEWLLWSDMAGVHPAYRGQGIGKRLKLLQREWALKQGYAAIGWTYDPLQARNAWFNLRLLGATSRLYLPNIYGEMGDALNAGLTSDRLEIRWMLHDERVLQVVRGQTLAPLRHAFPDEAFIVKDGLAVNHAAIGQRKWLYAAVPDDVTTLKRTAIKRAQTWQAALREQLTAAFEGGYTLVDFVREGGGHWYVLCGT